MTPFSRPILHTSGTESRMTSPSFLPTRGAKNFSPRLKKLPERYGAIHKLRRQQGGEGGLAKCLRLSTRGKGGLLKCLRSHLSNRKIQNFAPFSCFFQTEWNENFAKIGKMESFSQFLFFFWPNVYVVSKGGWPNVYVCLQGGGGESKNPDFLST